MTKNQARMVRPVTYSSPLIQCDLIEGAREFPIHDSAIVVNLGHFPVVIEAKPRQRIPAFSSETLTGVSVTSEQSILSIQIDHDVILGRVENWPGWRHLSQIVAEADSELSQVALWRSEQDECGFLDFSSLDRVPDVFQVQRPPRYRIKTNLWFAPAGTECLIHNRHDFIEFHVQIYGRGHMQKFLRRDRETLFSDTSLSPGNSHRIYSCEVDENGDYIYPWHQYYSETDCIWLAVEYYHEPHRDLRGEQP